MNRPTRVRSAFSKVSANGQTVIPRAVHERLGLKPGDRLHYRMTESWVVLDKAPANEADDPFGAFSEWSSKTDKRAYRDL